MVMVMVMVMVIVIVIVLKLSKSRTPTTFFYKCDIFIIVDGKHTAMKNGNDNAEFKAGKPGPKGTHGGGEVLSDSEELANLKLAKEAWKQIQKLPANVKRHLLKR